MKKKYFVLVLFVLIFWQCSAQKNITLGNISVRDVQINTTKTIFVSKFEDLRKMKEENVFGHLRNLGSIRRLYHVEDIAGTITRSINKGLQMGKIQTIENKENADFILHGEIENFYIIWDHSVTVLVKKLVVNVDPLTIKYSLTDNKTGETVWESVKKPVYLMQDLNKTARRAGTSNKFMQKVATDNINKNLELLLSDVKFIKTLE